ncbi:MAG: hypothetical protein IKY94_09755 [Lachnospiraceae bacterium]|nr:hypothetical protein [Lachnospiraceae bacterium]
MRYDFSKMNADSFELMIRSLNQGIFGIACEQYGQGPDGQREFVYNGRIQDRAGNVYEGKTFGQVKYKYIATKENDYLWLKKEIDKELKGFEEKDAEYRPNNYLFYTNIVLTPVKDTGVKDKINKHIEKYKKIIPNIYILGYDEVCALLDNNEDVRAAYAPYVLSGDVLMKLLQNSPWDYSEILKKYLALELEEDMYTRMEQAGSVTEKKISIEKVCVDIDVMEANNRNRYKFAKRVLKIGNQILGYKKREYQKSMQEIDEFGGQIEKDENFVLLGGPGRGKSTICQFISQIYRANYLCQVKYKDSYSRKFMNEIKEKYGYSIQGMRVPFKIILRDYAAWITRQGEDEPISVLKYMQSRINKITSEEISLIMLKKMLEELPWIFFFDGLDEVPESSNRSEVLREIGHFISITLREAKSDCMVIGTTRMQGYNNDFDDNRYKHVEVAELSKEDCNKYVTKLFEVMEEQIDKREEYLSIMREAMDDDNTSRLMKTPLQATIISILVKSGGKPPHERYSLYQQYYSTMVSREKQKNVIVTLNDNIDWVEDIHLLIANKLQTESEKQENPSAEIGNDEFRVSIKEYIINNMDEYYEKEEEVETKVELFLKTITHRICFLAENRDGFYSFSIRSMQEFFAGTYLVKRVGDKKTMENIRAIAYKSYWRNVLLFALGYIELEKNYLEPEIGALCDEMNGRNNLVRKEHTVDNVCLFGSWLALDILAEDIFKGKCQNKYIKIAARVFEVPFAKNYWKFNLIAGVQYNKLIFFIKEKYEDKHEYTEFVFSLYMKLAENEKNQMEEVIERLMDSCEEKDRIQYCIRILEESNIKNVSWVEKWEEELLGYIEADKVEQFLPKEVVSRLLKNPICEEKIKTNIIVKKFFFLQCLFGEMMPIDGRDKIYPELRIVNQFRWVSSDYRMDKIRLEMNDSFTYTLCEYGPRGGESEALKTYLQQFDMEYLMILYDYVINPSYSRYLELIECLNRQKPYLIEKFKENILYYAPVESEEEYNSYLGSQKRFEELFTKETIAECMKQGICRGLGYSVTCRDGVFDEFIQIPGHGIENFENIKDTFFNAYLFVGGVQLKYSNRLNEIKGETRRNLLEVLIEARKREVCNRNYYIILLRLLGMEKWEDVVKGIPVSYSAEEIVKANVLLGKDLRENYRCFKIEHFNRILSNIVKNELGSSAENKYLQLLPFTFSHELRFCDYVSEYEMQKLDEKTYQDDTDRLVVELLKLCRGQRKVNFENLFELNVKPKVFYNWLVHVVCECDISNADELGVKLFYKLQEEQFEGSENLKIKLFNNMLERGERERSLVIK